MKRNGPVAIDPVHTEAWAKTTGISARDDVLNGGLPDGMPYEFEGVLTYVPRFLGKKGALA